MSRLFICFLSAGVPRKISQEIYVLNSKVEVLSQTCEACGLKKSKYLRCYDASSICDDKLSVQLQLVCEKCGVAVMTVDGRWETDGRFDSKVVGKTRMKAMIAYA